MLTPLHLISDLHVAPIRRVLSQFKERRGLLDYFKLEEYFNIVGFAKALMRHAVDNNDSCSKGKNLATSKSFNLLDDFMGWFLDFTVLDLKDSWYERDGWTGLENTVSFPAFFQQVPRTDKCLEGF